MRFFSFVIWLAGLTWCGIRFNVNMSRILSIFWCFWYAIWRNIICVSVRFSVFLRSTNSLNNDGHKFIKVSLSNNIHMHNSDAVTLAVAPPPVIKVTSPKYSPMPILFTFILLINTSHLPEQIIYKPLGFFSFCLIILAPFLKTAGSQLSMMAFTCSSSNPSNKGIFINVFWHSFPTSSM